MFCRWALIFYLAIGLVLAGPVQAKAEEAVSIGFILTLSGKWSEFGEAQRNALQLARRDRPELFKNIKFVYEDCQYLGRQTVSAFHKLRTEDNVDLMFVWGVEPSLVLHALADRYQMPLLVSAQLSRNLPKRKYVVRTINYAEQYSEKLVEYFVQQGIRKIGLLKAELSFYNDRVNGILAHLPPGYTLEVYDELLPEDTDLRAVVSGLKTKKYDILGVYLTPRQIINFYRGARAQRIEFPTFGATPFQSEFLLRETAGAMDGAVYVHNDVSKEFHQRYLREFGIDNQIPWAANAYDLALLAGELLSKNTEQLTKEKILSLFTSFGERQGMGGVFEIKDSAEIGPYFEYPIVVKQIQKGKFTVIYR